MLTLKSKRFLIKIDNDTKDALMEFSQLHGINHSFVIQQAITKMSETIPTENDIHYIRGDTDKVQVLLSDTGYRLLELWSEKTGLSKSKLIMYALQQTVLNAEKEGV